jgi:hypothetical protein
MEIKFKMGGKTKIKITMKSQIKFVERNERRGDRRDHTKSHKICMTLVRILTCVNIGWFPARTARVASAPYIALRPSALSLQ